MDGPDRDQPYQRERERERERKREREKGDHDDGEQFDERVQVIRVLPQLVEELGEHSREEHVICEAHDKQGLESSLVRTELLVVRACDHVGDKGIRAINTCMGLMRVIPHNDIHVSHHSR